MNDDLGEMLALWQTNILKALASVGALVNAITETYMAAPDILSGADPNRIGVRRIHGEAPDRVGAIVLKDRLPRCPGIGRLPDVP